MFRSDSLPPPIPEQTLVPAAVTAGTLECMTADSAPTSSAARSMRSPACGKSKYQPERPAAAPETECTRSPALAAPPPPCPAAPTAPPPAQAAPPTEDAPATASGQTRSGPRRVVVVMQ